MKERDHPGRLQMRNATLKRDPRETAIIVTGEIKTTDMRKMRLELVVGKIAPLNSTAMALRRDSGEVHSVSVDKQCVLFPPIPR